MRLIAAKTGVKGRVRRALLAFWQSGRIRMQRGYTEDLAVAASVWPSQKHEGKAIDATCWNWDANPFGL